WRNWPRSTMPPLLRVLFAGYAWLPIAMALFATQSAWYAATGNFVLGRAPAHAMFIGFFGSLLVAMVTRVTHGHSGRPLALGRVAGFAFIAIHCRCWLRSAGSSPSCRGCCGRRTSTWLRAPTARPDRAMIAFYPQIKAV